jgi:hypothetical protein
MGERDEVGLLTLEFWRSSLMVAKSAEAILQVEARKNTDGMWNFMVLKVEAGFEDRS